MATQGRVLLAATVTDICEGPYLYPACKQCYCKLTKAGNWSRCVRCRQDYSPDQIDYRYRLRATITDSTCVANITAFGGMLKHFFGVPATIFYHLHITPLKEKYGTSWENIVRTALEHTFVGQHLIFGLKVPWLTIRKVQQQARPHSVGIAASLKDICPSSYSTAEKFYTGSLPELIAVQVVPQAESEAHMTVVQSLQQLESLLQKHGVTPQDCLDRTILSHIWNSCHTSDVNKLTSTKDISFRDIPSARDSDICYQNSVCTSQDFSAIRLSCESSLERTRRLETCNLAAAVNPCQRMDDKKSNLSDIPDYELELAELDCNRKHHLNNTVDMSRIGRCIRNKQSDNICDIRQSEGSRRKRHSWLLNSSMKSCKENVNPDMSACDKPKSRARLRLYAKGDKKKLGRGTVKRLQVGQVNVSNSGENSIGLGEATYFSTRTSSRNSEKQLSVTELLTQNESSHQNCVKNRWRVRKHRSKHRRRSGLSKAVETRICDKIKQKAEHSKPLVMGKSSSGKIAIPAGRNKTGFHNQSLIYDCSSPEVPRSYVQTTNDSLAIRDRSSEAFHLQKSPEIVHSGKSSVAAASPTIQSEQNNIKVFHQSLRRSKSFMHHSDLSSSYKKSQDTLPLITKDLTSESFRCKTEDNPADEFVDTKGNILLRHTQLPEDMPDSEALDVFLTKAVGEVISNVNRCVPAAVMHRQEEISPVKRAKDCKHKLLSLKNCPSDRMQVRHIPELTQSHRCSISEHSHDPELSTDMTHKMAVSFDNNQSFQITEEYAQNISANVTLRPSQRKRMLKKEKIRVRESVHHDSSRLWQEKCRVSLNRIGHHSSNLNLQDVPESEDMWEFLDCLSQDKTESELQKSSADSEFAKTQRQQQAAINGSVLNVRQSSALTTSADQMPYEPARIQDPRFSAGSELSVLNPPSDMSVRNMASVPSNILSHASKGVCSEDLFARSDVRNAELGELVNSVVTPDFAPERDLRSLQDEGKICSTNENVDSAGSTGVTNDENGDWTNCLPIPLLHWGTATKSSESAKHLSAVPDLEHGRVDNGLSLSFSKSSIPTSTMSPSRVSVSKLKAKRKDSQSDRDKHLLHSAAEGVSSSHASEDIFVEKFHIQPLEGQDSSVLLNSSQDLFGSQPDSSVSGMVEVSLCGNHLQGVKCGKNYLLSSPHQAFDTPVTHKNKADLSSLKRKTSDVCGSEKRVRFTRSQQECHYFNFDIISHFPVESKAPSRLKSCLKRRTLDGGLPSSQDLFSDVSVDYATANISVVGDCDDHDVGTDSNTSVELFSQSPISKPPNESVLVMSRDPLYDIDNSSHISQYALRQGKSETVQCVFDSKSHSSPDTPNLWESENDSYLEVFPTVTSSSLCGINRGHENPSDQALAKVETVTVISERLSRLVGKSPCTTSLKYDRRSDGSNKPLVTPGTKSLILGDSAVKVVNINCTSAQSPQRIAQSNSMCVTPDLFS